MALFYHFFHYYNWTTKETAHKEDLWGCTDGKIDFCPSNLHVMSHLLYTEMPQYTVISHLAAWFYHVILRLCTGKCLQEALNPVNILALRAHKDRSAGEHLFGGVR